MNIFQIYHDKKLIPSYVEENIKKLNPNYNYKQVNFDEGKKIIKKEFQDEIIKDKILYCLDNFPRYCHKSDLLRYCLLYIYGGIYIDVDLKPLISFEDMKINNVNFITSFGRAGEPYLIKNIKVYPVTSNGIIISDIKNPILLDLINNIITNKKLFDKSPVNRGENVFYLYNYLNEKCLKKNKILEPFKKIEIGNNQNIYMFNHIILDSLDVVIDKNKKIIHTNNSEYNFKRQSSGII
jgi:hypothetical protein